MKVFRLEDMTRGWFVGNFEPTAYKTESCEVAVKKYNAGDKEEVHYHKLADEITFILSGEISINNKIFAQGDIIVVNKSEKVAFKSITNSVTVVVKQPSAKNDKYIA